jgi:hypothetical protein
MIEEMGVLIDYPWLGLVPAAFFTALFKISKNQIVYVAQWSWLAYVVYEYSVRLDINCSGDCIRINLIVIYPGLIVVSFAALGAFIITLLRKSGHA